MERLRGPEDVSVAPGPLLAAGRGRDDAGVRLRDGDAPLRIGRGGGDGHARMHAACARSCEDLAEPAVVLARREVAVRVDHVMRIRVRPAGSLRTAQRETHERRADNLVDGHAGD